MEIRRQDGTQAIIGVASPIVLNCNDEANMWKVMPIVDGKVLNSFASGSPYGEF